MLDLRKIEFGSSLYQETLKLREKILRIPLGLTLTKKELERDVNDIHLGAFLDHKLVACLILSRLDSGKMKMRQVAVDEGLQGQGIGGKLVKFSEQVTIENQIDRIELSARGTAVDFYLRLGYQVQGESYSEQNIPHIKMTKTIKTGPL